MSTWGWSWGLLMQHLEAPLCWPPKHVIRSMVLAAMLAASLPAAAAPSEEAGDQRLRVGKTGIMCVKAPCPSRGVFLPTGGGLNERRRALLYTDADGNSGPPQFIGAPAAREAADRAWRSLECIEIMGQLEQDGDVPPKLHISRVLGPCR
ncbi:hypothetical protein [Aquamicrobium sp.]|uniref:hypothetical protein n=1 Tax=Aquamicrobium sp. TaxID=1872579 RepID=UPI0025880E0B|nr:hypothetical protein [Aquamicrobium sp.]MCK9549238.1 hypothetical protein [Aquamicrobium sp.]